MTTPYLLSPKLCKICKVLAFLSLGVAIAFVSIAYKENFLSDILDQNFQKIDSEHRDFIKETNLKSFGLYFIAFCSLATNVFIYFGIANIFFRMSGGRVFSLPTVKSIRVLGLIIIIYAGMNILSYPLMVGLWTFDNPTGHRLFSISLNTHQGLMLLLGGLFLIIGHIYTEAVRMADENRQYV